ncbi:hypothetical protein NYO98_10560 [Nocardioides sp. STR2]|uniref:Uncharacterized protein n=1 Tax=Nocardioides pini TaxID=2975053 RepID=A0ABT4CCN5_9ACTN|nr:hypothetical protein [Nocardioides pini]MCY4726720.1 hypothetical protein [Nocardioides pini]
MKEALTKAVLPGDRKRGMTLDQLTGLVQSALRDDLPPDALVSARVGFRGQVHAVTITPAADDA